jgi:hypothetical protein
MIWRAVLHTLRLCHKRRLGYTWCKGRDGYRECN